jgi:hypothetical protein
LKVELSFFFSFIGPVLERDRERRKEREKERKQEKLRQT